MFVLRDRCVSLFAFARLVIISSRPSSNVTTQPFLPLLLSKRLFVSASFCGSRAAMLIRGFVYAGLEEDSD